MSASVWFCGCAVLGGVLAPFFLVGRVGKTTGEKRSLAPRRLGPIRVHRGISVPHGAANSALQERTLTTKSILVHTRTGSNNETGTSRLSFSTRSSIYGSRRVYCRCTCAKCITTGVRPAAVSTAVVVVQQQQQQYVSWISLS